MVFQRTARWTRIGHWGTFPSNVPPLFFLKSRNGRGGSSLCSSKTSQNKRKGPSPVLLASVLGGRRGGSGCLPERGPVSLALTISPSRPVHEAKPAWKRGWRGCGGCEA